MGLQILLSFICLKHDISLMTRKYNEITGSFFPGIMSHLIQQNNFKVLKFHVSKIIAIHIHIFKDSSLIVSTCYNVAYDITMMAYWDT